jgi:hypothetical protein
MDPKRAAFKAGASLKRKFGLKGMFSNRSGVNTPKFYTAKTAGSKRSVNNNIMGAVMERNTSTHLGKRG